MTDERYVFDNAFNRIASNYNSKTLNYRTQLLSLFKLLHEKTFSKRGFSSSGKLLSSTLLTLTHTYPLENKFVNPDEWASDGMYSLYAITHGCI